MYGVWPASYVALTALCVYRLTGRADLLAWAEAAGIDWYESQMGPSFLIHGLTRIALLARDGRPCILAADYTAR